MKASSKLLALAGIAGALTLAGCGPAYDRSYGYGGYGGYGGYDSSYSYYTPRYRTYQTPSYYYAPRYRTYETPSYYERRSYYYNHDNGRRAWRYHHRNED
jgi:hypothetical protein